MTRKLRYDLVDRLGRVVVPGELGAPLARAPRDDRAVSSRATRRPEIDVSEMAVDAIDARRLTLPPQQDKQPAIRATERLPSGHCFVGFAATIRARRTGSRSANNSTMWRGRANVA
jgi:hypothetical protein